MEPDHGDRQHRQTTPGEIVLGAVGAAFLIIWALKAVGPGLTLLVLLLIDH